MSKVLDLFCGAGGAADGYHQAGFEIVGVDIKPQPHYPYEFILADALWILDQLYEWPNLMKADFIHTSPPCQRFSTMTKRWNRQEIHPDLIMPLREKLIKLEIPYIIENVPGAPLQKPIKLCGSMFNLEVRRHDYLNLLSLLPNSRVNIINSKE